MMRDLAGVCVQEAERSLHDALCVIRCLVHKRFMIAGGAAAEVEVATQLSRWAKTLVVCATFTCKLEDLIYRGTYLLFGCLICSMGIE